MEHIIDVARNESYYTQTAGPRGSASREREVCLFVGDLASRLYSPQLKPIEWLLLAPARNPKAKRPKKIHS
jgi:hypothetical protein